MPFRTELRAAMHLSRDAEALIPIPLSQENAESLHVATSQVQALS